MRSDMPQVLIERPRSGGGLKTPKGENRRWQRTEIEDRPRVESLGRRWAGCSKWQTDLLGPVVRFLRSRVGRRWDDVYSEICAEIRRESAVQDHLRDHVLQMVKRNVILRGGVPCSGDGEDYGRPLHVRGWWPAERFYVCPVTRRLRTVGRSPRRRRRD